MKNIQYFNLDHKVIFYIPSTYNKNGKISELEFKNRTELVAGIMSDTFGGATIQSSQGFYKTVSGEIVVEDVKQVISYCSREDLTKNSEKILNLALAKCQEWVQESIGLEIDNKMYFIS